MASRLTAAKRARNRREYIRVGEFFQPAAFVYVGHVRGPRRGIVFLMRRELNCHALRTFSRPGKVIEHGSEDGNGTTCTSLGLDETALICAKLAA